jgi:chromosome segregation ATPase
MAFRKDDLQRVMGTLNIPQSAFDDEDYRLFEKGGISISEDSDMIDTESLKDVLAKSFSSVDVVDAKINVDNILVHRLNQERGLRQMDNERTKYNNVIVNLEKRVIELEHEKNKIKLEKEAEIQRLIQENRQKYDAIVQESKKSSTYTQLHSKRNILNIVSDIVNDAIPEIEYARLRDIPERELREEEAHLVHVWEMINPIKTDNKNLQIEIARLRDEVRETNQKYQNVLLELRQANDILERRDDDVKRSSNNYETSIKMLGSELNKAHIDLESLREKGNRYDELYRDFVQLEKEKISLESKLTFFSGVSDIRHEAPKNEGDLKAKYAILCTDKEYLSRENVKLHEQNLKLEDKIERLEADLESTRKMAKDYITEMMTSKSSYANSYEKKISDELSDLKDKQKQELETVKDNLKDIYERQISFLKDNKEELELKCEKLSSESKERNRAYEEVQAENRNLQRRVNIDLSEIRVQLRIKTDELERMQNLYEEANSQCKTFRYENDMLREKNNVLKGEYYKLEANMKEESAGIRAQLAVSKEQLSNYEAIENEIDRAVTGLGNLGETGANDVFMQTLHGAPTASRRRIQQAIALGQRLNAKQKECEELISRLTEVERRKESLEQELTLSKSLLNKTDQPYSYLIQNIEEREVEVRMLKEKLRSKDDEFQHLKVEHDQLLQDYNTLNRDLNKVMIKRENIKKIQSVLVNLLQEDRENYNQNDLHMLVEEINAISENKMMSQTNKQVTIGGTGFYEKQFETPTRDGRTFSQGKSLKQQQSQIGGGAPQWYNKLRDTLRK